MFDRPGQPTEIEVLFTPADFGALAERDLTGTVCVVFDVLRATSSMIAALANGAAGIIPVRTIPEALALKRDRPELLLAGERDGLRIDRRTTGGVEFDFGNSPREFVGRLVADREIVMTTTNGTRALRACVGARVVLVGSFLNLGSIGRWITESRPDRLLVVCAGTVEQTALEDVLGAGALCEQVGVAYGEGTVADSVHIARNLWLTHREDLTSAMNSARNGRRLLEHPELSGDVHFSLRPNVIELLAVLGSDGVVRVPPSPKSSG